jgi:hypothetical protein
LAARKRGWRKGLRSDELPQPDLGAPALFQAAYEAAWLVQVAEKNLCDVCGIPKIVTIQSLWDTQSAHFYEPCSTCKPIVEAFFLSAGLCLHCKGPLTESSSHCPRTHTA